MSLININNSNIDLIYLDKNKKYDKTQVSDDSSIFLEIKSSKINNQNNSPSQQTLNQNAENIEEIKNLPPENISKFEIKKITDLNTGIYKDQVVQMTDGKFYEFDPQGRVTRVYNEPKKESKNGTPNSFTYIIYNDDGSINEYIKYENEGKIINGQRKCGIYNNNGELQSYYIDSNFDNISEDFGCQISYDKEGKTTGKAISAYNKDGKTITNTFYDENNKITGVENFIYDTDGKYRSETISYDKEGRIAGKIISTYNKDGEIINSNSKTVYPEASEEAKNIHNKLSNITPENLNEIFEHIENLKIENTEANDDEGKDNIQFVMDAYEVVYGKSLLEALAETPNGKIPAQEMIDRVKFLCSSKTDDDHYKYTDDIQKDMESHPNDYKKLSVDLKRMLNRSWLSKTDNDKGEYGDNDININGIIDSNQNVNQNLTGDCYLIASIIALSKKPEGAKAIKEMVHENNDGSVTVTLKGVNKSYTISQQELLNADMFSVGDDDMRVIEIAFDKYRRDLAYESENYMTACDIEGGYLTDVTQAIFGQDAEDIQDGKFDIKDFNNQNVAYLFNINIDGTYNDTGIFVKNTITGEKISGTMVQNHEYAIVKSDENNVYFINPWDKNEELSMNIEDFKSIQGLNISSFKFA